MSYSSLYLKKGRNNLIILGVFSVLSVLVGSFFFINQVGRKNGWQQITGIERVLVVNRTPHGFEVIWSTKNKVDEYQWVEVGANRGDYSITSSMDSTGGINHAAITGLSANTTYHFRIRAGTKTYTLPQLVDATVQTPKEIKEKPLSPAYGKVVLPSMRPYANGMLIYEIDGFYPLATFTKSTGEWLLPLTGLIEKKSNSIVSITDNNLASIKLFSYPESSTRTSIGQTRPLKKTIIAGTSSNLTQSIKGGGESILGVTIQTTPHAITESPSITYPKENALIPGNAPLIRGRASIGGDVTILIQSPTKQYSYRTKADEKGDWLVQYPLVLDPGKYSILATMKNDRGTSTVSRRSFTIIKSGEQVMGVATGSPTLAPTMPIPTYANPTTAPIPITSTPLPTNQTTPPTIMPTQMILTATPPVTGGGMSGFLFGALFCIVIGAGLVLAF